MKFKVGTGQRLAASLLTCALSLVGCSGTNVAPSGSTNAADFKACMLTMQTEDLEPRNHLAAQALEDTKKRLGISVVLEKVQNQGQIHDVVKAGIRKNCNVIIGIGDRFVESLQTEAKYHRERKFALFVSPEEGVQATRDNLAVLKFDYSQPAYIAGYLAAGTTASNRIGVVAGRKTLETRQVVSAFVQGVGYFNREEKPDKPRKVNGKVDGQSVYLGENPTPQALKAAVKKQIDAGADVIFLPHEASQPVALKVVAETNRERKAAALRQIEIQNKPPVNQGTPNSDPASTQPPTATRGADSPATSPVAPGSGQRTETNPRTKINVVDPTDAVHAVTVIWYGSDGYLLNGADGAEAPVLTSTIPEFPKMFVKTVEDAKNHQFYRNSTQIIANYHNGGSIPYPVL